MKRNLFCFSDLPKSGKMLTHVVHLAAISNFAYALYFDIYVVQLPIDAARNDVSHLFSIPSTAFYGGVLGMSSLKFLEFKGGHVEA